MDRECVIDLDKTAIRTEDFIAIENCRPSEALSAFEAIGNECRKKIKLLKSDRYKAKNREKSKLKSAESRIYIERVANKLVLTNRLTFHDDPECGSRSSFFQCNEFRFVMPHRSKFSRYWSTENSRPTGLPSASLPNGD
jgi:hypothetical protein